MNDVTLLPEAERVIPPVNPTECSRGHMNDPYPHNGRCVECGVYLPSNPTAFTPETGADAGSMRAGGDKSREEIAHAVLEDEGVEWDDATEGMRQLALLFAKSKNVKTYELILQQIGVLKSKPRPGETETVVEYQVSLTAATVGDLKASLADLDGLV